MSATLCTLEQVKDRVGVTTTDDDGLINSVINAVTRAIMVRYGREFVPRIASNTRIFAAHNRWVNFKSFDLRAAASVILHPEGAGARTLTEDEDFTLEPIGGDELTGTYLALRLSQALFLDSDFARRFGKAKLQITGDWGVWADATSVAADVNEAAIETAASWLDRGVLKVTGINALGEPHGATPASAQGWDIPLSAHRKLMPYARNLGVY